MALVINHEMNIFNIKDRRVDASRIGNLLGRVILSPLMLPWFVVQLLFFTLLIGWASFIFGNFIFFYGLKHGEDSDIRHGLMFMVLPFVSPFIWVLRYAVHGEYSMLYISI